MRNLFSILLFVVAGFCIHALVLMGFFHPPAMGAKKVVVLLFAIPSILALWSGFALDTSPERKKHLGITLLLAAGFATFTLLTIVCMQHQQEFQAITKSKAAFSFNDYLVGVPLTVGLFVLGLSIVRSNENSVEDKNN